MVGETQGGGENVAPGPEITPGATYTGVPCKHCGGPVLAPKRRGVVKDFCRNQCRANFRVEEQRKAVERIQAQLEQTKTDLAAASGEVDRIMAVVEGALQFIAAHLVIGRRPKKVVDTPD